MLSSNLYFYPITISPVIVIHTRINFLYRATGIDFQPINFLKLIGTIIFLLQVLSMQTDHLLKHRITNWLQSALLLLGMILLLAMPGWFLGGPLFMIGTVASGIFLLALGPKIPPRLLLGMYGGRRLTPYDAPQLYTLAQELAKRAGLLQTPVLYYIPSQIINAFTVGKRTDAVIAITDGLLRQLTLRELAGVLAHEIGHIRNNDIWVMTLADLASRMTHALSLLGQLLVVINLPLFLLTKTSLSWLAILLLILAPTISALLQLALSRTREFDADLSAVNLTGDPQGLASALVKLERQHRGLLERLLTPDRHSPEPSLLRTHPRTEERIQRLLSLKPKPPASASFVPSLGEATFQLPPHFIRVRRKPHWHITGLWH
ncbi:peptidase, M48 family [Nitrosococcus oceani AFC27]|nr:peptidase, M48 family [Nitrosococcus oceani AFC27]KFI19524.1 peptidase M48 [Nitrosococcus oceani C-27]